MYAYSNMDEVELFVNGKSYGRRNVEKNWYVYWENVCYEPGQVVVKGFQNGEMIIEKVIETTGVPAKIEVQPYQKEVRENGVAIFKISITDEKERVVPTADNELYFTVEGAGSFLGAGNGNPGDHASDRIPVRRAFNGLCEVLVQAKEGIDDRIRLIVAATGLQAGICEVEIG